MITIASISRVVRSAFTYTQSASRLTDGNISTQADIQWAGSGTVDYLMLDLGAPTIIAAVGLTNVVVTGGCFIEMYGSNNASLLPNSDGSSATQFPVGNFTGATSYFDPVTYAAPSGVTTTLPGSAGIAYRYLFVAPHSSEYSADSIEIGEIVVNPQPPIPVPSLTATPVLINNVPTILLQGR